MDNSNIFYYVTICSNFVKGFDKYNKVFSKANIQESTFPDKFFLLKKDELKIGIKKASLLLNKTNIDKDYLIVLETHITDLPLYKDHKSGLGQYIKQNFIKLNNIYKMKKNEDLQEVRIEDIIADGFMLNFNLEKNYNTMIPRTISLLPVKNGCQANCPFCFSSYSISADLETGFLENNTLNKLLLEGKKRGAKRAVITCGGEPTLISSTKLNSLIKTLAELFPNKVVLITNGYKYATMKKEDIKENLILLKKSGLTDLAISHHHYNNVINEQIM